MSRGGRIANRIIIDSDGMPYCPECGVLLDDARSEKHMGLFFVFLKHCFESWPDDGVDGFWPIDERHLRAWLLYRTGHMQPYYPLPFNTKRERDMATRILNMQMEADRANGIYGWPQEVEGGIAIMRPASIAVYGDKKISEKKFCQVTEKVFTFLYDKLGIDVKEWKESGKKGSGS